MKSYFSSNTLTSHWWKDPHVKEFSVSTLEGSVRPQGPGALRLLSNSKDTRSDTGALHWCSDLYQRCGQTIFDTKTSVFFLSPQSVGEGHRHTVQLNKPPCTARQCSLYIVYSQKTMKEMIKAMRGAAKYLADPGEARGCSRNTSVIN